MVRFKALCVAGVCAVGLGAAGAGTAFAGEVTGPWPNGTPLWVDPATHALHGASACAYSGLNILGEDPSTLRTQSWATFFKEMGFSPSDVKSGSPSPGTECNPTRATGGG